MTLSGRAGWYLEAILAGERDPEALATLCSTRIKASRQTVAKSLHGNWREELLFALRVALESYRFAQSKIAECDERIGQHLAQFEDRAALDTPPASLKGELHRICGVDLTKYRHQRASRPDHYFRSRPGYDPVEHREAFASFLGLCPNNSISGGKVLRRSTRKVYNRAADALRLCSQSLTNSKTALGAKYRRLKGRLGAPKAIVAMAHHLARLVYRMLRYGRHYVEKGMAESNKIPTSTPQVA